MVAEARERAEAVLEICARIGAGGPLAACFRLGDKKSSDGQGREPGAAVTLRGLRADVVEPYRFAPRASASPRA